MTITLLYAGLLSLWFFVLSVRVIRSRQGGGVSLGDGGNLSLQRRIRAHGNFAEYVPLALLLMALLETSGSPVWLLHALGVALFAGRLLHGYALSFTEKFMAGRVLGTVLTFAVIVVAAGFGICKGLGL